MDELTPRQQQILQYIREQLDITGLPPTRAEIATHFDFRSANAAEGHLRALAKKGAIELLPGSSRGIRLLGKPSPAGVPVVGRVAAGSPILADEYIEDYYDVDPRLFRPAADYLLRVHGHSMKNVGILDGDLLAVHRQQQADDGQIVVARLETEVTVKRLKHEGDRILLLPENADFEPIEVDPTLSDFSIEGIAVGVIRRGQP
ncbi:unnamed protein product, partial [Cyprideis torosa]